MAGEPPTGSERIPLFPLELVLFPGAVLPLHIFEPRYKEMIGLCLESKQEFGIVLVRGGQVALTGCTAEILSVAQKYPDGRMDIVTMGRRIFRVEEWIDEKAYYEARVSFLAAAKGSEEAATDDSALQRLYDECHRAIHGRAPEALRERESTAFQIAIALPLEMEIKQGLLEEGSEKARREKLRSYLELWLPRLRRIQHMKAKSGGNGHG